MRKVAFSSSEEMADYYRQLGGSSASSGVGATDAVGKPSADAADASADVVEKAVKAGRKKPTFKGKALLAGTGLGILGTAAGAGYLGSKMLSGRSSPPSTNKVAHLSGEVPGNQIYYFFFDELKNCL